jgi:hypothetical protein
MDIQEGITKLVREMIESYHDTNNIQIMHIHKCMLWLVF